MELDLKQKVRGKLIVPQNVINQLVLAALNDVGAVFVEFKDKNNDIVKLKGATVTLQLETDDAFRIESLEKLLASRFDVKGLDDFIPAPTVSYDSSDLSFYVPGGKSATYIQHNLREILKKYEKIPIADAYALMSGAYENSPTYTESLVRKHAKHLAYDIHELYEYNNETDELLRR